MVGWNYPFASAGAPSATEEIPSTFAGPAEYVAAFEPLLFEECRAQVLSQWEEASESAAASHMPVRVTSLERADRGICHVPAPHSNRGTPMRQLLAAFCLPVAGFRRLKSSEHRGPPWRTPYRRPLSCCLCCPGSWEVWLETSEPDPRDGGGRGSGRAGLGNHPREDGGRGSFRRRHDILANWKDGDIAVLSPFNPKKGPRGPWRGDPKGT